MLRPPSHSLFFGLDQPTGIGTLRFTGRNPASGVPLGIPLLAAGCFKHPRSP